MTDIVYRWGIEKEDERAATISLNVSLPQFKVKDLTQDATVEFLATGTSLRFWYDHHFQVCQKVMVTGALDHGLH